MVGHYKMPFGQLWKKNGDQIIPTSGVDTIRIPGGDEYATITRTDEFLTITSGASGNAILKMDSGASQWQIKGSNGALRSEAGTKRVEVDGTGLGFFNVTPVARQAKVASPAADAAALVTAFDELQTKLQSYGLLS